MRSASLEPRSISHYTVERSVRKTFYELYAIAGYVLQIKLHLINKQVINMQDNEIFDCPLYKHQYLHQHRYDSF